MNLQIKTKRNGFIALIALLILAAAALSIGISANLSGFDQLKVSLAVTRATEANVLVRTCLEDGLEGLRKDFISFSNSLSINDDSCIMDVVVSGNQAYINATGTVGIYSQKIQVLVDNNLNIISW